MVGRVCGGDRWTCARSSLNWEQCASSLWCAPGERAGGRARKTLRLRTHARARTASSTATAPARGGNARRRDPVRAPTSTDFVDLPKKTKRYVNFFLFFFLIVSPKFYHRTLITREKNRLVGVAYMDPLSITVAAARSDRSITQRSARDRFRHDAFCYFYRRRGVRAVYLYTCVYSCGGAAKSERGERRGSEGEQAEGSLAVLCIICGRQ